MEIGDKTFKYTADVTNGILNQQTNESSKTKTAAEMNSLGKDTFLTLLVTQMQNQDPLEPTKDTEWVSQLATYSSLEEMQNMNKTLTNSQALNLVGQTVIIQTKDSAGDYKSITGMVDFVTIKDNNALLSVGGTLYSMDELVSIVDKTYIDNKAEELSEEETAND